MDATDQGAVVDQLLNTGVTPVDIRASAKAVPSHEAHGPRGLSQLLAPGISLLDTALFSRQMYTLLKAGVPIMRALGGLQESAINPRCKPVVADLRTGLDSGRERSACMR